MGLICFAGGDTSKQGESREIKGNQGKSREIKEIKEIKGNQGESREIKRSQGDQCEPRKNEMK